MQNRKVTVADLNRTVLHPPSLSPSFGLVLRRKEPNLAPMFDLKEYMDKKRELVDLALDNLLPGKETPPGQLHEAMRYSVFSGGKRLRPILCLAAAEVIDPECSAAIMPAVAIELLHTYTLIHDDLPSMDDDDTRRGRPANHIMFGEANAVLAGDALQALAFEAIAAAAPSRTYGVKHLLAELASAAGSQGVVGGQVEDMACDPGKLTAERIEFIHRHKTADLFRCAIRMGAMTAGASSDDLKQLTEFATNLGMTFQIVDDILDENEESGDERSCLRVYGVDEARRRVDEMTRQANTALAELDGNTTALKALTEQMAVRSY